MSTTIGVTAKRPNEAQIDDVQRVVAESFKYIDHPFYTKPNIEQYLFEFWAIEPLPCVRYSPSIEIESDHKYVGPLLKRDAEKMAFLRFNFCKRKLAELKEDVVRVGVGKISCDQADGILLWHKRRRYLQEYICLHNIALVPYVVTHSPYMRMLGFDEMISSGNVALSRSINKFDVNRNLKFSTYACSAIYKSLIRCASVHIRQHRPEDVSLCPFKLDNITRTHENSRGCSAETLYLMEIVKRVVDECDAGLLEIERSILVRRFNLDNAEKEGYTLEAIGAMVGLTKERIRQIQNEALAKIRKFVEKTL